VVLNENFAMVPVSSVSGYIFSHTHSSYFNLGKISADQLKDYAKRKNFTNDEAAKWLSPNL
jgi:5-methyltetrahydrofolate--homocysteine methyltransferase